MANVMFKRGLHQDLPSTGSAGAFYLTTDTNRLYVCNTDGGSLIELNQSITTVASISALPTTNVAEGQYYYAKKENVLAYWDGSVWNQINPDATLVDKEEHNEVYDEVGATVVKTTIEDTEKHTTIGTVKFVGEDAVTTKADDDNKVIITAHDTSYEIGSEQEVKTIGGKATSTAKITLTPDENSSAEGSSINVFGGTNITVENTEDGVKISAADAANMYNTDVTHGYGADGSHTVIVTDGDGELESNAITPTIKYGKNGTEAKVFVGGADVTTPTATLDVYTIDEVDSLISMADAMHYKGTVDQDTAAAKLSFAEAQKGDTWKAASDIEVSTLGISAKVGDLIIANGTEVDGSLKDSIDAVWEVIPSGDSQVIGATIESDTNFHSFIIEDNADGANGTIGAIEFYDDGTNGNITITSTATEATASSGPVLELTVSHGKANERTAEGVAHKEANDVAQQPLNSAEFTAVTTLIYDENGHIVNAETGTFTVTDTHNQLKTNEYETFGGAPATAANDNALIGVDVTVTNVITSDDEEIDGSFTIASDTLKLAQNSGTVSIDIIWGSF